MSAEAVTRALQGRWYGSYGTAFCPAHRNIRTPALSLSDGEAGRLLFHCFSGCEPREVLAALRASGLVEEESSRRTVRTTVSKSVPVRREQDERRRAAALRIWDSTAPAAGSLAETYLRRRGLTLPLPPTLRFHPALKHPCGECWPALVALVTDGRHGKPVGIHRTFMARDGEGKAPVELQRMMLGPCRGGARAAR